MLSVADNELLVRTGPDTGMGRFFRSFWIPVALSRELPQPDGAPIRVRILGEDLIAFRAGDGRVVPTFINQALHGDPLTCFGDVVRHCVRYRT